MNYRSQTVLGDNHATYRYYLLQSSTLTKPAAPTTNPPGGSWTLAEPSYTAGSTNSLYTVDLTVFSDGSFLYSIVSLSSSYEAAKAAYNKAVAAGNTADEAAASVATVQPFIVGTQTAATYYWTGVADTLTELVDGQQITYWLPYSCGGSAVSACYTTISSGAATNTTGAVLNLTLADGSMTGNIPVWYSGVSRVTSHYTYGNAIHLTYRDNSVHSGSYRVEKGWWADANYNTTQANSVRYNNAIKAAAAITAGRIIVGTSAGYVMAAAGVQFDISYPVLYAGSAISAGGTGTNNLQLNGAVTLRNNKSGITLTAYSEAYLVGTLSGSIFTIDEAVFANAPTEEDGKYYMPIGMLYSTYQITFDGSDHSIYYYMDGGMRRYEDNLAQAQAIMEEQIGNLEHDMESTYVAKSDFGEYRDNIETSIRANAAAIIATTDRIESIAANQNAFGNELQKYLTVTHGQMTYGFFTDPGSGQQVYGIAVAQNLQFAASGNTSERDGQIYYELEPQQSLAMYTSTGWQYWLNAAKVGWFEAGDGQLHTPKQVTENDFRLSNWLFTDLDGLGIKYIGG